METSSFASESVTGPSDIIAALPGILGFYPTESLVILGLNATHRQECVRLGPVLRVDLTHATDLCASLDDVPLNECVGCFAVIVSRIPESELVHAATAALFSARTRGDEPLIDVCWHVSEIATGSSYRLLFGPGPEELLPALWQQGTVASVMSSPAMKSLLENGILPELDREDTFRYFAPLSAIDDEDEDNRRAMQRLACRRGVELSDRSTLGDRAARCAVAEACLSVYAFAERPLVASWDQADAHAMLGSEDDRITLAALLSRSCLRDRFLNEIFEAPLAAAHAMMCVAKTFTGVIRANALSVWAIIALDKGLVSWATAALTTARTDLPGHVLSGLLLDLVYAGQHERLIEAVREGAIATWDDEE